MGNHPRVRSPLVEGLAVLGQRAFTGSLRNLTTIEELLLRSIFKDSVDYEEIQIGTTNIGVGGRPYTLANTIRIPPGADFNTRTLVHETTHVWQYQTKGSGYISDSLWHQAIDKSAYNVTLVANQCLSGYTAEQQAVIVEAYYVDQQAKPKSPASVSSYDPSQTYDPPLGWSLLPDVVRMISELQRTRPISDQARLEDRLFGPGGMPKEIPGGPKLDHVVPILRIEFDF
jgi:hypothetical protein